MENITSVFLGSPLSSTLYNISTEPINESYADGKDASNGTGGRSGSPGRFIHVSNTILQPIICSFGILGNLLIIIILTRHRVRRSVGGQEKVVHIGFFAMAVSDMLFCFCALPRAFIDEHSVILPNGSFRMFYQLYSTGLLTTFSLTGTWLIVVTAGIRYIGICHPFQARSLVSSAGIYTTIASVLVICICGNLPSFWIITAKPLAPGVSFMDLGPFSHFHTRGMVFMCARTVCGMFLPGLLLVYFNVRLLVALGESSRLHSTLAPQQRTHSGDSQTNHASSVNNRLTRLLVTVIVSFVVLMYPCEIMEFFALLNHSTVKDKEAFIIARVVVNLLQISNFAFNFLLYCVINGTFRHALAELVCPCRGSRLTKTDGITRTTAMSRTRTYVPNGTEQPGCALLPCKKGQDDVFV